MDGRPDVETACRSQEGTNVHALVRPGTPSCARRRRFGRRKGATTVTLAALGVLAAGVLVAGVLRGIPVLPASVHRLLAAVRAGDAVPSLPPLRRLPAGRASVPGTRTRTVVPSAATPGSAIPGSAATPGSAAPVPPRAVMAAAPADAWDACTAPDAARLPARCR